MWRNHYFSWLIFFETLRIKNATINLFQVTHMNLFSIPVDSSVFWPLLGEFGEFTLSWCFQLLESFLFHLSLSDSFFSLFIPNWLKVTQTDSRSTQSVSATQKTTKKVKAIILPHGRDNSFENESMGGEFPLRRYKYMNHH